MNSAAYAYNYNFQNGKNDEMNKKFYHKYCAMVSHSVSWRQFTPLQLGELLEEFSFDYELDASKVSQLINTCIEKAMVSYSTGLHQATPSTDPSNPALSATMYSSVLA